MGSCGRLWALTVGCALAGSLGSCAINPQPEPPDQAEPTGSGGNVSHDAGPALDAGVTGGSGGMGTGGFGGDPSGGSGGSSGGVAGSGANNNGVPPGAFDESYKDDDTVGARVDVVNETDAGESDAGADAGDAAPD